MAQKAFKFRKGPICLTDDEFRLDSVDAKPNLSRFDVFTTILHFLSIYDRPWPAFREVFVENFVSVIVLLSVCIIWSIFNMWLLRKHRMILPHIFTIPYNISMTFCLIYFPAVCCCRIYDKWSTMACAYLDGQDKDCLPIYSTILETEVVGLACAFVVVLTHLIHITARVIAFIVHMSNDGKYTRLGTWLYDHGYSTTIAIYGVSSSLAMIGFFMMLWAYDFIITFGSRESQHLSNAIWAAHSLAGFDILTLGLLVVQLWFIANVIITCQSRKPMSGGVAYVYDFVLVATLTIISLRCSIRLNQLEAACEGSDHCGWIWKTIRPRQIAAIILALLISFIHLSLCLNRLRYSLQWAKDRNRIKVLLHDLNNSDDFGSLGKLHEHFWTDEQMTSIFRIETTGDKVREYISSVLHQIHVEEVAAFKHEPSKYRLALRDLRRMFHQKLDGSAWNDDKLALLYNALYEMPKENLGGKEEGCASARSPNDQELVSESGGEDAW